MTALVRYDAARLALQSAVKVDEVKDIRDKALAMAAYARQANDTQMVEWATEIRVRAERRAGEMLAEMPKQAGARGVGKKVGLHDATPLSELGIDKTKSSRWQKLAAIPEKQFEQAVAAAKEVAHEVTTAAILRATHPSKTPKKPTPKAVDPEPDDPDNDPVAALEYADKEIRNLQALVESLKKSDLAKEVETWAKKYAQLEGRLNQEMTTCGEAKKQATYSTKKLAEVRAALGVKTDREILAAIKELKRG